MSGNTKVLTGLMERRALEAAFSELAEIANPVAQAARAEEIARQGKAALRVLLSMLDTDDPQLRGGLGEVAARLDRDEVVPALRRAARSPEQGRLARLTALTILARYLGEPVDESLLLGLEEPEALAQQSLHEALREMARNPFAAIEYLQQLAEQPREVAAMILDAIPTMPASRDLVTLLRMFAQAEDAALAREALDQLGRLRTVDSALALASLASTLPPPLAVLAERGLRKLRLSGIDGADGQEAAGRAGWRALLSPISGSGHQAVWFIRRLDGREQGILFSILTRDPGGITGSFGSMEVPARALPPARPVGTLHKIAQSADLPPIAFLEVPFDAGRQAAREALERNWESGSPTPLEYRLLNPLIWGVPFTPDPDLLPLPAPRDCTPADTAALLDHPAFASWFWQDPALIEAARDLGREPQPAARRARIVALARAHFSPERIAVYRRRLTGMARWLALAAQAEAAALALGTAEHLAHTEPADSPFIRRLIGNGLDLAIINLHIENLR